MIKDFEELECWKQSRKLVYDVYKLSSSDNIKREWELNQQIKRAALSVMNNIAEGFTRFHKKEFVRFLDIAQGSASEVLSILYVIEDLELAERSKLIAIREQTKLVRKLVLGLVRYIQKEKI